MIGKISHWIHRNRINFHIKVDFYLGVVSTNVECGASLFDNVSGWEACGFSIEDERLADLG